jgi:nicotinate-nucleotide adenylyltransferase
LLVGADAAGDLPAWREAGALPGLATVAVLTRPGTAVPDDPLIGVRVAVPAVHVSASEIRARCARGATIRDLVPDAVRALIAARGLYREG